MKLNPRNCWQRMDGVSVEPEPDWSFDDLVLELNALETKLATASSAERSSPLDKTMPRYLNSLFQFLSV